MKTALKTGLLFILLILPVLVYLFLKVYGNNHYTLPVYFPLETIHRQIDGKTQFDTVYHQIPDFSLINQLGNTITGNSLSNKILIADFFFTRCPGICPIMTSNLTKVQESFIDAPEVQLISFSVDPDYDQPDVLKKYAEKFLINSNKWLLATGPKMDIYNLGFYGFKLPSDTIDETLHSEKIVLVDKEKRIRGYYNGTSEKEIERLITEIKVLQHGYAQNK